MTLSLLDKENTGLIVLDVQERLMEVMGQNERTLDNITKLLHLSRLFDLPLILTEQYPRWLGSTVPEIRQSLSVYEPIEKMDFNCCNVGSFNSRLESTGVKSLMLVGVETHICIFQTCFSLLKRGYEVHVPQDAVDSRTRENWTVGLGLMRDSGAVITSTETVVYQILERVGSKKFKEMLKIIK
ncbi:MAG: hydrolase [Desulfobacteraceae bacterium]|nr:hydrolase [Desulfobacteraceae bacterium]